MTNLPSFVGRGCGGCAKRVVRIPSSLTRSVETFLARLHRFLRERTRGAALCRESVDRRQNSSSVEDRAAATAALRREGHGYGGTATLRGPCDDGPMTRTVRGARVLITGAASGMGRLYALRAVRERARAVVLWDRDDGALQTVVAELRAIVMEQRETSAW